MRTLEQLVESTEWQDLWSDLEREVFELFLRTPSTNVEKLQEIARRRESMDQLRRAIAARLPYENEVNL